jgi:hypothetical protein
MLLFPLLALVVHPNNAQVLSVAVYDFVGVSGGAVCHCITSKTITLNGGKNYSVCRSLVVIA